MPTNKQRRQAAQRHLQRQLERRAELARKRRRTVAIVATVAVVAVVVLAGVLIANLGGNDKSTGAAASAGPSSTAAAASTNADGTVNCDYQPDTGNPNLKDVGTPPTPDRTPTQGTVALTMATNQGNIGLTLDRAKAPCAAASFAYLASKGFFDNSTCHREVNQPTFGVLQCGDPSGTGSGGPTYKYRQEVTPQTTYPRGTIAMANTGQPNSTGSQFFLVFADTQLPPDYTVVGTVDQPGLAVLDTIAKAGNDGSFEPNPGGGKPKLPVTITTMTVAAA